MNLHPKQAWDTAKMLRSGLSHHHKKPQTDKLRDKSGNLSQNDKEFTKIFGEHFRAVFSREDIAFDPSVLDPIPDHPTLTDLDYKPTFEELLKFLRKAENHKASGQKDLPMDALKVLAFNVSPPTLISSTPAPSSLFWKCLNQFGREDQFQKNGGLEHSALSLN